MPVVPSCNEINVQQLEQQITQRIEKRWNSLNSAITDLGKNSSQLS